ncbi:MAG TPA: DUF2868 domain-containing protein [Burkholderiaceae bacterium]|nr:DUF2868 domain-containing protein [Burkholderiaceae bacterium]
MTDNELAAVCWVRAVEQGAGAGVPWDADDAAWASREARRAVGEGGERARAEAFVVRRAQLAARRLAERDAAWREPLQRGEGARAWRLLLLLLAAAVAALIVGNVLGASRINLLAPPVLGLLAWNLAVYALLLFAAGRGPSAWLARALDEARTRLAPRGVAAPLLAARARFAAEWAVAMQDVQQQRVAATMHVAAALLALLVIASMYVFGLAFDYRAGWDSTWLDAEQVQRTLAAVFAPATALSGIEVPGIDAVAKLRFAEGSAGERAARWIHLYAITLALVVVVPRLLLGAWAAWRARRIAARRALPLDEPYFRTLLRDGPTLPRPVTVLPYSYTLSAPQVRALPKALADAIGPGAQAHVKPTLPLGAEDALPASALEDAAGDVAALFAATATPERETHGAFVRVLASALAGRATLCVLVDESAFRQRGGAASDAELRLTQRRAAWQRMLHDLALPAPRFIDLS